MAGGRSLRPTDPPEAAAAAVAAAQRLLRRTCVDCKEPIKVPDDVLDRVQFRSDTYDDTPIHVAR